MPDRVQDKEDVLNCLRRSGEKLASFGVRSVGLFGSFVTGRQTPASDIDILVEFIPEQHSFDNFMEVSFLLEDLFQASTACVGLALISKEGAPARWVASQ